MHRGLILVTHLLILVLGVLSSISLIYSFGVQYADAIQDYPNGAYVITIDDAPQDVGTSVVSTLGEFSSRTGAIIIRQDKILSPVDGSIIGYELGVLSATGSWDKLEPLFALGREIVSPADLTSLDKAEPNSTLGLSQSRADMIRPLPSIGSITSLVVKKLPDMISQSGTINGEYKIVGATKDQFDQFIQQLSESTRIPADRLQSPLSGNIAIEPLAPTIALGVSGAVWVVILFLMVLTATQSASKMGIHLLLGWSKAGYILGIYFKFLITALLSVLLTVVIGVTYTYSFGFTGHIVAAGIQHGAIVVLGVVVAGILSSMFLWTIKPVDAIRNRISKRLMLGLLSIVYICLVGGLVGGARALDGPIGQLQSLEKIQSAWSKYENLELLYRESVGRDQASFTRRSAKHFQDFFNWYSGIEGKDGVYLVHSEHYNEEVLNTWRNTNGNAPQRPFWYLNISPNFLEREGIRLSRDEIRRAEQGTRLLLIPDSYSATERSAMEEWFRDFSLVPRGDSIVTPFMKNPQFEFVSYTVNNPIFTWSDDANGSPTSNDPVILVTTVNNMTPFESESLSAVGLSNSLIKLTPDATEKYLQPKYLAQYSLEDNTPIFLPAAEFIAGLQKTISELIKLFGGILLLVAFLEIVVSVALVRVYTIVKFEAVGVRRLLGHPLHRVFALPLLVISIVSAIGVLAGITLQSNTAIIMVTLGWIMQLGFVIWQARELSIMQVNSIIKQG